MLSAISAPETRRRVYETYSIESRLRPEYSANINNVDHESGRVYEIHLNDGSASFVFPSLTTILSKTKNQQYLKDWYRMLGKEKAEAERDRAAQRGTDLHSSVEAYLGNLPVPNFNPLIDKMFKQLVPKLDKHIGRVSLLEYPLFSKVFKVAGRVDIVAEWDGIPSIIDIKSSTRPKEPGWILDYYIQETGYAMMVGEMFSVTPKQIVTLMAVEDYPPSRHADVFVENTKSHKEAFARRIVKYYRSLEHHESKSPF